MRLSAFRFPFSSYAYRAWPGKVDFRFSEKVMLQQKPWLEALIVTAPATTASVI
jgi:hypothetical protein